MSPYSSSVLVIGATGGTGIACIKQLAKHASKPTIHAFCRDPAKLSNETLKLLTTVQKGNARKTEDIEKAIKNSKADWIIISVGNGENVAKNDIRQVNAQATVSVLSKPQYEHVRAVVVSSTGAGTSKIVVGMGLGKLISFHLRHILADHTAQEAAFAAIANRTLVVRATALQDGAATGNLQEFGDQEKSPTLKTDRADLACWITDKISENYGVSRVVNVTSVKH